MPILKNALKSFDALSDASEDFLRFERLRERRGFLTRRERWGILNGKDAAKSAQAHFDFCRFSVWTAFGRSAFAYFLRRTVGDALRRRSRRSICFFTL